MLIARVADDDGVLVLASALTMKSRFASREFNYDFPEELVSAANAEELCSWQTGMEGDVTITVHVGRKPPPDALFLGVLRLQTGDELLVLPYSQYTMACSSYNGEPEDIEGLCVRLQVDPGRYACWCHQDHPDDDTPLVFDIYLPAAIATDKPLREVPTLEG